MPGVENKLISRRRPRSAQHPRRGQRFLWCSGSVNEVSPLPHPPWLDGPYLHGGAAVSQVEVCTLWTCLPESQRRREGYWWSSSSADGSTINERSCVVSPLASGVATAACGFDRSSYWGGVMECHACMSIWYVFLMYTGMYHFKLKSAHFSMCFKPCNANLRSPQEICLPQVIILIQ